MIHYKTTVTNIEPI